MLFWCGMLFFLLLLCTFLCLLMYIFLAHSNHNFTSFLSVIHHWYLFCIFSLPIQKCTERLVKVLKDAVNSPYAPEYDIAGIADPFLQIRLLRIYESWAMEMPMLVISWMMSLLRSASIFYVISWLAFMMSDIVYSHLIAILARLFTFLFARGTCACSSTSADSVIDRSLFLYLLVIRVW